VTNKTWYLARCDGFNFNFNDGKDENSTEAILNRIQIPIANPVFPVGRQQPTATNEYNEYNEYGRRTNERTNELT